MSDEALINIMDLYRLLTRLANESTSQHTHIDSIDSIMIGFQEKHAKSLKEIDDKNKKSVGQLVEFLKNVKDETFNPSGMKKLLQQISMLTVDKR